MQISSEAKYWSEALSKGASGWNPLLEELATYSLLFGIYCCLFAILLTDRVDGVLTSLLAYKIISECAQNSPTFIFLGGGLFYNLRL